MHQRQPRRVWRAMALQPSQRELEHRPDAGVAAMPGFVVGQFVGGRCAAQRRQARAVGAVDARQRLAALPGQLRARASQPRIGGDASAERLAGHLLHHVAFAETHVGLQHQRHGRHRHAGAGHLFDDACLGLQRGIACGALVRAFGRAAQHQRKIALPGRMHDEGPGFLAGATAQPLQRRYAAAAAAQARRQRIQAVLQGGGVDHARKLRAGVPQASQSLNCAAGSLTAALATPAPRSSSFLAVTYAAASLMASTASSASPR